MRLPVSHRQTASALGLALLLCILGAAACRSSSVATPDSPAGDLYVLAVGIDNTPDNRAGLSDQEFFEARLPVHVADAETLAALFVAHGSTFFSAVHPVVLLDAQASFKGISEAIRSVARQVHPSDSFVFIFSGPSYDRTSNASSTTCLAPADGFRSPQVHDPARCIPAAGLMGLMRTVPARNQLVILDIARGPGFLVDVRRAQAGNWAFIGWDSVEAARAHPRPEAPGRSLTFMAPRLLRRSLDTPRPGDLAAAFQEAFRHPRRRDADGVVRSGAVCALARGICEQGLPSGQTCEIQTTASSIGFPIARPFQDELDPFPLGPAPLPGPGQPKAPAPKPRQCLAVLFATNRYAPGWPRLDNPVSDAENIAAVLKADYRFDTKVVANPTKAKLREELARLQKMKFETGDELLVFVAGHGVKDTVTGVGYLVGADAPYRSENLEGCLSLTDFRLMVSKVPCPHLALIMDVCHGGTLFSALRGIPPGKAADPATRIAVALRNPSRRMLTSGADEPVQDGPPGFGSPMTYRIVQSLRNCDESGIVSWERLVDNVRSGSPTTPLEGPLDDRDSKEGDFLFISKWARTRR